MKETETEISHWIQAWMFSGSFLTDELVHSNAKIIIMFHLLQVIAAEGEMNASRALKEAADIISESPSALQLRYLQTLTTISAEKNSTIIFPLPVNFLSRFLPSESKWLDGRYEDRDVETSVIHLWRYPASSLSFSSDLVKRVRAQASSGEAVKRREKRHARGHFRVFRVSLGGLR